jgi:hypothetical protein
MPCCHWTLFDANVDFWCNFKRHTFVNFDGVLFECQAAIAPCLILNSTLIFFLRCNLILVPFC